MTRLFWFVAAALVLATLAGYALLHAYGPWAIPLGGIVGGCIGHVVDHYGYKP